MEFWMLFFIKKKILIIEPYRKFIINIAYAKGWSKPNARCRVLGRYFVPNIIVTDPSMIIRNRKKIL